MGKVVESNEPNMAKEFVEAVDSAITHVVADFQGQTSRFWNERDIHWYLFHYLKQDPVFLRDYGTELIRAEFPTRAVYIEEKKPARGHYDLVILEPSSVASPPVSELPPWAPWEQYLPFVEVLVAVEVKTWVDRADIRQKADWDIQKLTDPKNAVRHSYFLNFVQMDFGRRQMRDFYQNLRGYLMENARRWPELRILCVPHDKDIQPDASQHWIH